MQVKYENLLWVVKETFKEHFMEMIVMATGGIVGWERNRECDLMMWDGTQRFIKESKSGESRTEEMKERSVYSRWEARVGM